MLLHLTRHERCSALARAQGGDTQIPSLSQLLLGAAIPQIPGRAGHGFVCSTLGASFGLWSPPPEQHPRLPWGLPKAKPQCPETCSAACFGRRSSLLDPPKMFYYSLQSLLFYLP